MNYTPEQLERWLLESCQKAAKLGRDWSVKQGELTSLEDRKNDYLALLTHQAEGKTSAEKERNARLHHDWTVFRDNMIQVKKEVLVLRMQFDVEKRRWETIRSLLSSKNVEMRMLL